MGKKTITVCDHCGTETMGYQPSRVTIVLLANGQRVHRDLCERCTTQLIDMVER